LNHAREEETMKKKAVLSDRALSFYFVSPFSFSGAFPSLFLVVVAFVARAFPRFLSSFWFPSLYFPFWTKHYVI